MSGPGYTNATTPLAVKNHVILAVGGDRQDIPAWVESRDPDTGEQQWRWNVTPRKGEPGIETWPNEEAAIHGGGGPWQPFTYDAELNNVIVTTANPNPVLNGLGRPGENLYTSSIVALNADTGKMQWYFQCSPHDVRDWDATQTVMLFEGVIEEDRASWRRSSPAMVGSSFSIERPGSRSSPSRSSPHPTSTRVRTSEGNRSRIREGPVARWGVDLARHRWRGKLSCTVLQSRSGLLYINATEAFSIFYLTTTDTKSIAWGGASEQHVGLLPVRIAGDSITRPAP